MVIESKHTLYKVEGLMRKAKEADLNIRLSAGYIATDEECARRMAENDGVIVDRIKPLETVSAEHGLGRHSSLYVKGPDELDEIFCQIPEEISRE